jgi:class 3 adenylate cyclase
MASTLAGSYPLPDDPLLADAAAALHDSGAWGHVVDHRWNLVYVSDELRFSFGGGGELASFPIGHHYFGPESQIAANKWKFGSNSHDLRRPLFAGFGPFVLADTPGGRDELRTLVDPCFHDLIDDLSPSDSAAATVKTRPAGLMGEVGGRATLLRIRDSHGRVVGTTISFKPAAGMSVIGSMTSMGDPRHFANMQRMASAARRPSAILFADLEGSTQLSRRLSTSNYFALSRRLVRAADQCIIDAGGLVGRHVGDGVVAFFVAETIGSESAAAQACISAARALRSAVNEVATRSELQSDDVVLRFGLHWGSTLYVGSIITAGRTEVTALGDEVNETARIEACATGGRALASKDLIERLDTTDATALGIDPDRMTYTALTDLASATDKAIRDARAISVCEV